MKLVPDSDGESSDYINASFIVNTIMQLALPCSSLDLSVCAGGY